MQFFQGFPGFPETLFCASSDERSHGKFAVVLARTENFVWVLEERRDNARMKFWHMSCLRSNELGYDKI